MSVLFRITTRLNITPSVFFAKEKYYQRILIKISDNNCKFFIEKQGKKLLKSKSVAKNLYLLYTFLFRHKLCT